MDFKWSGGKVEEFLGTAGPSSIFESPTSGSTIIPLEAGRDLNVVAAAELKFCPSRICRSCDAPLLNIKSTTFVGLNKSRLSSSSFIPLQAPNICPLFLL
jgi:hypothetical protein